MSKIWYVETEKDLIALLDRSNDDLSKDDEIFFRRDITLSKDLVINKPIKRIILNGNVLRTGDFKINFEEDCVIQ